MTDSNGKRRTGRRLADGILEGLIFFRYNAANVFAGRAILFMILASSVFLAVVVLNLLSRSAAFSGQKIFDLLLVPGILLVFYPAVFALQNDKDARMIENLFGIPDYRYKIWLARYFTLYVLVAALLFLLGVFCILDLIPVLV